MLFEPSKKPTYYRFPSFQSVAELDNRMYFPEKPDNTKEDIRHDHDQYDYMPEKDNYSDDI
ncbi:hypothetical protein DFR55_10253 [Herbinix hemicellulosilytica]|uniref:Uncharacterized protein n=1 Tax=Herbinix hemicellulosilytica TaxID=1564487 RepID=A0A0H5STI5_HERHM|nr:hypothetical protein [Herbinix hemicellulosilytica]RBP60260.1 hypothetical protein DFR55_10253 [Herbinix hemicellulosilytica]CRZ33598.1 hypothetical protein HHT355_0390 [Herbinix hemicellulosilytica]